MSNHSTTPSPERMVPVVAEVKLLIRCRKFRDYASSASAHVPNGSYDASSMPTSLKSLMGKIGSKIWPAFQAYSTISISLPARLKTYGILGLSLELV